MDAVTKTHKRKALKEKLKYLIKKTISLSFDDRIKRLNWLIRGWVNYFKHANIKVKLKKLDE